jgi:glutathione S-transferase
VRLALEEAGTKYIDVAREPGGEGVLEKLMSRDDHPPFAPPFLEAGRLVIAQTANILFYLGGRHGLAPKAEGGRLWTHQLQLTLADLVAEIHDSHHPVASGLYYEDQKAEAARRARDLRETRLPKYLGYFAKILEGNGSGFLVGRRLTYPDLSLFQIVEGLRYAFPRAMGRLERSQPGLPAHHDRVSARPRIAAYLSSPRRLAFNENGIFRRYSELDG